MNQLHKQVAQMPMSPNFVALILILQLTPMGSRELYNQLRLEEITKA